MTKAPGQRSRAWHTEKGTNACTAGENAEKTIVALVGTGESIPSSIQRDLLESCPSSNILKEIAAEVASQSEWKADTIAIGSSKRSVLLDSVPISARDPSPEI